ncbi:hypothetical protein CLOSTHATH_03872 [Hungatella hathewayi DSM 13479]|uniref:Uncharacterized protein n=1 Tax=Hungatella hathewayi DSM 13479 TaxID=566550 RepID=D3AJS9_9FIRM|nr:hypothetical protein CLOSTHATH_03872 [Hungatella hathewayi DSM 13479]
MARLKIILETSLLKITIYQKQKLWKIMTSWPLMPVLLDKFRL